MRNVKSSFQTDHECVQSLDASESFTFIIE